MRWECELCLHLYKSVLADREHVIATVFEARLYAVLDVR